MNVKMDLQKEPRIRYSDFEREIVHGLPVRCDRLGTEDSGEG